MPVTKKQYPAYLSASDCWKITRQEAMRASNWICGRCFSARATEVHHKTYDNLGNERPEELWPLCRRCHCIVHGLPLPPPPKPANDNQLDLFSTPPKGGYSVAAMAKLESWLNAFSDEAPDTDPAAAPPAALRSKARS